MKRPLVLAALTLMLAAPASADTFDSIAMRVNQCSMVADIASRHFLRLAKNGEHPMDFFAKKNLMDTFNKNMKQIWRDVGEDVWSHRDTYDSLDVYQKSYRHCINIYERPLVDVHSDDLPYKMTPWPEREDK